MVAAGLNPDVTTLLLAEGVCSVAVMSAVGPSSQRVWNTEMIVGGNRAEAALPRGLDGPDRPPERQPLVSDLHQRHMDAQVHAGLLSDSAGA